jgi:hypothetical protein
MKAKEAILDQDGRTFHFYTDLTNGKAVAVQFVFTTCTTICPPLGATEQFAVGCNRGRVHHRDTEAQLDVFSCASVSL